MNKHHEKVKAAITKQQNLSKFNKASSRSGIQVVNHKEEGPKEVIEKKIASNIKQNVGKIAVGQTDSGMFQLKNSQGGMNLSEKNKSLATSGNNSSGVVPTDKSKDDTLVFLDEQATAYRFKTSK